MITACGDNNIMGGVLGFPKEIYKVFNFSIYPPIFEVTISFTFYKIDDWNSNNLSIIINNETAYSEQYSTGNSASICGDSLQQDQVINVRGIAAIDSPIVNISISVDSTTTVLWGLRAMKTSINRCDSSCLTCFGHLETECSTCYPLAFLNLGNCICQPGFYQDSNKNCTFFPCSSCLSCNIECKACSGPSENNCTECYDNHDLLNSNCVANLNI